MSVEYNLWLQLTKANALSAQVEQNTADIIVVQNAEGGVPALTEQVNTNTADITTLQGQVSANTGNIATNTSNIATSADNIATNTSNITTLQGLVLPVWKSGGGFINPAILLPASVNTLITSQTIVTTTTTAKYLILASFVGTTSVVGTIYMTIGRSTNASPTATNTINLTNRVSALTNFISGNGLSMWRSQYNTTNLSAYASVVDTPAFIGSVQYSVWSLDTSAITNTASELVNLTILQVLP